MASLNIASKITPRKPNGGGIYSTMSRQPQLQRTGDNSSILGVEVQYSKLKDLPNIFMSVTVYFGP